MSKTQDPTQQYIRTEDGETFYVETLDEAIEEFAGDNGYRLTLHGDKLDLVIRRGEIPTKEDEFGKFYEAYIVIRPTKRR